MRISYAPWGETLAELVDASVRAERAGAEVLWLSELHRSATGTAAAVAAATGRAQVGTAVLLAFTRSPMTTALETLDLDELSGGRFVLGLGTGVRRLNEDWHNARFGRPVAHLRETVRDVRAFWAACASGEDVDLAGEEEPMRIRGYRRPYPPPRTDVPVYLAAMGPALLRLAGEVGDGWISHELCSPAFVAERALPGLEEGAARAGRARSDFDVVVSACCSVDADPDLAVRRAAGHVAFYASVRTYAEFFEFHGFGAEQARVVEAFRAGTRGAGLAAALPPELVHALTFAGTREQVAQRLRGYQGLADTVKISPPTHGLGPAEIRAAQDELLGLVADLTADLNADRAGGAA